MQLSDLSVKRPVFAAVMAMLLTIVGIVGFFSLPIREYPDTDPPVVSVNTSYIGAAANVVEIRVTELLEQQLAGIPGIRTISSRTRDGQSEITIEFNPGRSIDDAAADVRDRVSRATGDLPDGVLPPEIRKVDADAQAIIWFTLAKPDWSRLKLSDYVDRVLADRFSAIDGVSRVYIGGEARPSMRIWLEAGRLAALGLTPADVEAAIRRQNVELPAGRIESADQNITIRISRSFATPAHFSQLVVGRGSEGYLVRLGDVARIEEGPENPYALFRVNGQPAVGIGIVRQSGANTLAVAQAARATAEAAKRDFPPGMTIRVSFDTSFFISRAIAGVYHTLAESAVLVVLVILLFLGDWRATLIPAITVPICLLGTFAVLWLCGFSINLLTLLALVLSIGLVVDDAIVVLENVYHRIEEGDPPLVAAYLGTRQVGFAVISTTIVVCTVFVPIMFLAGQTGLLFRELAAAMIGAIAFSGFLALSLTPMLCSKFLRRREGVRAVGAIGRLFDRVESGYAKLLDRALNRPSRPLILLSLILAGVAGLFAFLPSELAPEEDVGMVRVNMTASEGTGFDAMSRYARQVEAVFLPMERNGPLATIITRVPGGFSASDDFNNASQTLFLKPWDQRSEKTSDIVKTVNKALADLPAVRGNASVPASLGRGQGQPINFVIVGEQYEALTRARDRIIAAAATNPGIINLDSDYKETKPQLMVDVDTARAGDLGISVDDVGQALQTLLGSRRVSTYLHRGEEYRVIVQADAAGRIDEGKLASVYVRSRSGELVPLSNLVALRAIAGARELNRYNKQRAITLSGGIAPGYSLGEALTFLENTAKASPEVIAIGYRGESKAFKETGGSIWLVFGLTILIVYLVLAAQFESFIHPAVIITTVPLAIAGGVIGLAVMGQTLNLYSQVGLVMLVGLAAKNGILIVEFANQLRDAGVEFVDSVRQAARRRLRPILMTSIATVAGAVPLMIATGAGAAARRAIGVIIVWGVSIATLITLFLIPILYVMMARRTGSPQAVTRRLQAALGAQQPAE